MTVGGFVIGAVTTVEVVLGDRRRHVTVGPGSSVFVVALPGGGDDHVEAIDVRALDASGTVIDSTAEREAERRAALPGITVAEALALPSGSEVVVRGLLLALPGEGPMLCDDVGGDPPRCRGATLRLDLDAAPPPTIVEDGGLSTIMCVVTGVVRDGVLSTRRRD